MPDLHWSDCATNNRGVPDLLGPCDCGGRACVPSIINVEGGWQVVNYLDAREVLHEGTFAECEAFIASCPDERKS